MRAIPGGSKARVIQGEKNAKQDAARLSLPANSILNLMQFDHAVARAYLQASYRNVEQVVDAQALRLTRRGLTQDGLGSGAYAVYRCDMDDSELVFGLAARERALQAKQNELQALHEQNNEANTSFKQVQQSIGCH